LKTENKEIMRKFAKNQSLKEKKMYLQLKRLRMQTNRK